MNIKLLNRLSVLACGLLILFLNQCEFKIGKVITLVVVKGEHMKPSF